MDVAKKLASDGFAVVDNVFDPDFIDGLREEYGRQYPDLTQANGRKVGDKRIELTIRMTGPFLSPDLYANPTLLALARGALGEDMLIDSLSAVTSLPGSPTQHRHRDHSDLFPQRPIARAIMDAFALNFAIPLLDLTPETGTTRLFTGSHYKEWSEDRFEMPFVQRGSCYVLDYRLMHEGSENRSDLERPIIYLVYARPWFIDITNYDNNPRISIAAEDLAEIPEEHRPLFRRLAAPGSFDRSAKRLFDISAKPPQQRA